MIGVLTLSNISVSAQNMNDLQKRMQEAKRILDSLKSDRGFQQKMKSVQHKVKGAQHVLDGLKSDSNFQNKMRSNRTFLDSLKAATPSLRNIKLPNVNDLQTAKLPNFDSLENNLNKRFSVLNKYKQGIHQAIPKANSLHHADGITKLTQSSLLGLVNNSLEKCKAKFNTATLSYLNSMVKNENLDPAGTGAFLLASGASKDVALFLICKGILKNPEDAWAVNDLGVYFRDMKNIPTALQCYFYANTLLNGKSVVINTNIGWASFYYGDFSTAQQYFDRALSGNKKFNSAREGNALLGYAKGNIVTLFRCLTDEINDISIKDGFKNKGPSNNFVTICAGIFMENEAMNDPNVQTNPTTDHIFDNSNPVDEGIPQDPPPGADVEPVTYPSFKGAFPSDGKYFKQALIFSLSKTRDYMKREAAFTPKLMKMLKELPPLVQAPYVDGENFVVYPNTFRKYVDIFHLVQILFEKRLLWHYKIFYGKIAGLEKSIVTQDADLMRAYFKAISACNQNEDCENRVDCEWIPRLHGALNSDLDAVANVWKKYYDNIHGTVQWYINATAPLISRVHQIKWNQYLNVVREVDVRKAILKTYYEWKNILVAVNLSELWAWGTQQVPPCPVEIAGINPPDPFSKKPKHIKEFQGPCYDQTYPFLLVGGIESNCHGDKFYLGGGPFKGFYSHTSDQIAAQNQGYSNKLGFDASVSKDIDIVKVGEGENEKSLLSASGGVEGSAELNFDNNWNFTGGKSDISASASIGGHDIFGVKAGRSVEMVGGQANVSPLSVTTTGILH